jgi:DNA-binding transcriptional ArsR family regulator
MGPSTDEDPGGAGEHSEGGDLRAHPSREETSGRAFVEAIAHPLRSKLIVILSAGSATSAELATEIGAPVRTVRHHLRYLSERGFVSVAREETRRNVLRYSFEETTFGEVDDELYAELTPAERRNVTNLYLRAIARAMSRFVAAAAYDVHFPVTIRMNLALDEEGWRELREIMVSALDRLLELKGRTGERLPAGRGEGFDVEVALLALQTPGGSSEPLGEGE